MHAKVLISKDDHRTNNYQTMKRLILLTALIGLCLTVLAQTKFYTSEKLSSNQINNICQDKVGYIWVGTEFGLNKYDGYRFTKYLHDKDNPTSVS